MELQTYFRSIGCFFERPRVRVTMRWILRILVAAVFIFSAVSKMVGIGQFELYIHSFGFIPLNLCFIVARLCIGTELVLALFTLCGWFPRTMRLLTAGILIVFSLFLCFSALIGRNDNCQCFGQLVDFNPMQSLLKNAILLALVLLYYKFVTPKCLIKRWLPLPFVLAAVMMVLPFVDYGFGNQDFNKKKFAAAIAPGGQLRHHGIGEGRHIVAFVMPGCPFCHEARRIIDSVAVEDNLPRTSIIYIEPESKANSPETYVIPKKLFLDIVKSVPHILFLDGERIVGIYGLEDLNSHVISQFLK